MSFQKDIEEQLGLLNLSIFDASMIYKEKFNDIPEVSYYQSLERMYKKGLISRISKGLYGINPSKENIIKHYTYKNSGMIVGELMYKNNGLINYSNDIVIYSKTLNYSVKRIDNITIIKHDLCYTKDIVNYVELFEIIEHFDSINNINKEKFWEMVIYFKNNYNDLDTKYILDNIKYKKRTIASIKYILDHYNIDNSLSLYLKTISNYKIIDILKLN